MQRITVEMIQAAYSRMGYQPIKEDWHKEGESPADGRTPVYFACPQTTILELAGLISHDEEGPNIESAADEEWGAAYANGFRDGWDGLEANTTFAGEGPQEWTEYEQGYEDGQAAARELLPAEVDA